MNKSFIINNTTKKDIVVSELGITIMPGISNLFDYDNITFDAIMKSMESGTLAAALQNGCYIMPSHTLQQSLTSNVIVKPIRTLQIHPSRTRFVINDIQESVSFDFNEEDHLFNDKPVKSARELEEELNKNNNNVEKIEAVIKKVNLPEKPIEIKYIATPIEQKRDEPSRDKAKRDIRMGYETCSGMTKANTKCMRQAGKDGYCGWHKPKKQ